MADRIDPADVMATNPYLSQQQQRPAPDKWSVLGHLLVGAGAGISQADAAGRGWASGIAPGLMAGWQKIDALQKQADDQSLRRAHYASLLDHRRPRVEATSASKDNAWVPLGEGNGRMYLGPAYDPTKAYQRNTVTGEIRLAGIPRPVVDAGPTRETTERSPLAQQPMYRSGVFNRR